MGTAREKSEVIMQSSIQAFKKIIENMKEENSTSMFYLWVLGIETFNDELKDIKQKVQLPPIPETILKAYRGIFG